jgi:hypothetical protein
VFLLSRSRIFRVAVTAVALLVFYIAGIIAREHRGIRINIRNQSGEALRQISLSVERGGTYRLTDLAPGEHNHTFVKPVEESSVDLRFTDAIDRSHVETVVGYAEALDCENVTVTIFPAGKVKSNETRPFLVPWKSWLDFM